MRMNKKAQIDLDDLNLVGIIFGIIGGLIAVFIVDRMGSGLFWKLAGFLVSGIVCYFIGGKIADD